jgi:hypothetical protein
MSEDEYLDAFLARTEATWRAAGMY